MLRKKVLKGITLLELVIAISVSTIVFVGVTGLFIFININNDNLTNDTKNIYNASFLAHAIELRLDEGNGSLTNLPETSNTYIDDFVSEIIQIDELGYNKKLFTVNQDDEIKHYFFYKQHFGYVIDGSYSFNNIYTSESEVKIEFTKLESNQYSLILFYGETLESQYIVIKNLYTLEGEI